MRRDVCAGAQGKASEDYTRKANEDYTRKANEDNSQKDTDREKVRMGLEGKQIGSQFRQTLKQAGYTLVKRISSEEVVLANEDGNHEVWFKNDHSAGWTIEINGVGYEFAHGYRHRYPRIVKRSRRLANGQIIMGGSLIGFIAPYCPMCDGSSTVIDVDPEFTRFKCMQCEKTWSRPTHTIEFDMQRGILQPDIINTVAGAYQKAVNKATDKRGVKPAKRKQTTRRRVNAKKGSKKK